MKDRITIKREAKALLRDNLIPALVATALVLVTLTVLERLDMLLTYGTLFPELTEMDRLLTHTDSFGGFYGASAGNMVVRQTPLTFFFSILTSLFTTVLWGGYYLFCMGIKQGLQMPYSTLFDGLAVAGRLIVCGLLTGV